MSYTNQYESSGAFRGLKSTDDFAQYRIPENFNDMLLMQMPGPGRSFQLLMSRLGRRKPTPNQEFKWATWELPTEVGTFTATEIYTDSGASSAATGTVTAGDIFYIKLNNDADETPSGCADDLVVDDVVIVEDADDSLDQYFHARVINIDRGSSQSVVGVKALNTVSGTTVQTMDTVAKIGNAISEGGTIPDSIDYIESQAYNYTQKIWTPMEITPEAMAAEVIYGGPEYQRTKKEKALLHQLAREKAFLFGDVSRSQASNTKSLYTSKGALYFTPSANKLNYVGDATHTGTWEASGKAWLEAKLELLSRYVGRGTTGRKIGFCGGPAILGINQLAESHGTINIEPGQDVFGLQVARWLTPVGVTVDLIVHPLFNQRSSLQNAIFIFEPENYTYRPLVGNGINRDMKFMKDPTISESGYDKIDAIKEGWITQAGVEVHYPNTQMLLMGVGSNNT